MSIWDDKKGRKHVGIMVDGKRIHRKLPEGATTSDAKLAEAELRTAVKCPAWHSFNGWDRLYERDEQS